MSASRPSPPPSTMFAELVAHVLKTRGRVAIHPNQNVLVGTATIRQYLGLRSNRSLYILIQDHGLPVFKGLDGRLTTSCTMIDYWITLQAEIARDRGLWGPTRRKKRERRASNRKTGAADGVDPGRSGGSDLRGSGD